MQHDTFDTFDDPWTTPGSDDHALPTTRVTSARRPPDETAETPADDGMEPNRSEAAFCEREKLLFRTTFERAPIGIAHVAHDGRWLRSNQRLSDLLGYSPGELARLSIQDLTHSDDLAAELDCIRRTVAGELDEYELEKRYVRKDGALVWTQVTVSLVRTPNGEPDYFIVMLQDITARKRLEEDRARLLGWEQAARREKEATNAQLHALQALTDTALYHLTPDDLLGELLDRVKGVMGVENSGILLLDEDGQTLSLRAARGPLMEHADLGQGTLGQGFAGRIAASRAPLIADAPSAVYDEEPPIIRENIHSLAGVPLLVEDPVHGPVDGQLASRLVGVLAVGSDALRHFTEADVQLLQRVADRVALAIDRAHLYAAEQDARQQAEAALVRAQASEARASERAEQLHTILDTIADGVAVYDAEGRPVQLVNRSYRELIGLDRGPAGYASMTARDRASVLHMRAAGTGAPLPPERIPSARALRGEVVRGPDADLRLQALDGRELEVNASAAPLREPDGRIVGAVVVLRDMTERNRLEREREKAHADELAASEASRRMEAFLAMAAHDLRTPLTATLGYIALAERQTKRLAATAARESPEFLRRVADVRQRLDDASQGAHRLSRLLTRLFDTAAIRAGKLELLRAPGDLATVAREQVAALRVAAPDRPIRLHTPPDGKPVLVEADADRIGQVITNYVTNALKYSPPDRPVDVSVEARGSRALVTVRDQGPGIPKEERARVWELFHRVPGVAAQAEMPGGIQGGSLGLGLHICKAIITAHGGRVGVKSAVGEGSTFWFILPLSGPRAGLAGAAP